MSGKTKKNNIKINSILQQKFDEVHVKAALKHFLDAKEKYQDGDWEGSISKSGKFVEAVTKMLVKFCGKKLPRARDFHAGVCLLNLKNESKSIEDTVRIVIPKCCLFIYEISSNRDGRHDSDEISANRIDAGVTNVLNSWVLGELIRFSSQKSKKPEEAQDLIEALAVKTYPFFEEIDDKFYINIKGLSAEKTALLILYGRHPRRTLEDFLCDLVERHGFSNKNSEMAARRMKNLCDLNNKGMKLRGLGRAKAETLLDSIRNR